MPYAREFEKHLQAQLAARGWTHKSWTPDLGRTRALFDAGSDTRLTSSWSVTTTATMDRELQTNLRLMRARSRDLANNDGYMKKFLSMCRKNIIGPNGITFQSKIMQPDGTYDTNANDAVEAAWADWGKKQNCTVTGRKSWRRFQEAVVTHVVRDGEVLIQKVKGWKENKYRYTLKLIEADYLDELYNVAVMENGNRIVMGIEFDRIGRRVAYHLWENHPGDVYLLAGTARRVRVPAEDIIHVYVQERETQSRGIPWIYAAMIKLQMLGGYEEAELVAARVTAAKPIYYKTTGAENIEASLGDGKDNGGNITETIEPGMARLLPVGVEPIQMDPNHPTQAFPFFMKAMLRGIASAVDVCYNYFASDLEGVNYGSLRGGAIDERDAWRMLQGLFIEECHDEVFPDWLSISLLAGAITYTLRNGQEVALPSRKFDKFNAPKWTPRSWDWVDPKNDIEAADLEMQLGSTTLTEVCAKKGRDVEDVLLERARELKLIDEIGKRFGVDLKGALKNPNNAAVPTVAVPTKKQNMQNQDNGGGNDNA